SLVVSNGFLPGCDEANDVWPGVCQSWVITTFSNFFASSLMIGTISSPLLTGSVPPGTKQFCTSTTISAESARGLMAAARTSEVNPPAPIIPRPARVWSIARRFELCISSSFIQLGGARRSGDDNGHFGRRRRVAAALTTDQAI